MGAATRGARFCSLAGRNVSAAKLRTTAGKMTRAAHRSGFDRQGVANYRLQVAPGLAQAGQVGTILDLVLGPLDLNLLGLMIHLDRVHLRITADPASGILGSLLCSLAGGPPPAPAPLPAPSGLPFVVERAPRPRGALSLRGGYADERT